MNESVQGRKNKHFSPCDVNKCVVEADKKLTTKHEIKMMEKNHSQKTLKRWKENCEKLVKELWKNDGREH